MRVAHHWIAAIDDSRATAFGLFHEALDYSRDRRRAEIAGMNDTSGLHIAPLEGSLEQRRDLFGGKRPSMQCRIMRMIAENDRWHGGDVASEKLEREQGRAMSYTAMHDLRLDCYYPRRSEEHTSELQSLILIS